MIRKSYSSQQSINRLMATDAELKQWLTVKPTCKSTQLNYQHPLNNMFYKCLPLWVIINNCVFSPLPFSADNKFRSFSSSWTRRGMYVCGKLNCKVLLSSKNTIISVFQVPIFFFSTFVLHRCSSCALN